MRNHIKQTVRICCDMDVCSNSASIRRCPRFYYSGSTWLHGCRPGKYKVVPISMSLTLKTNTVHTCTLGTLSHGLKLCLPQTTNLLNQDRQERSCMHSVYQNKLLTRFSAGNCGVRHQHVCRAHVLLGSGTPGHKGNHFPSQTYFAWLIGSTYKPNSKKLALQRWIKGSQSQDIIPRLEIIQTAILEPFVLLQRPTP